MGKVVLEISDLSKQYRLGQVGRNTISEDVKKWWFRLRGLDDPFGELGEENDRTRSGSSNYVWALKDINFKVEQGDVLGIIGRNGAGKSTLLKILSRTTFPTKGEYKVKGRIASLLEVGTGFHPDLTGRENIYLNGAILGMTKSEIKRNFDEIVAFSGVERYIDTPVKRYSSGMYVRLAFAVAAHLDPEILIIDEVLAVGDQDFQNKCIGKMKSVSESGRTVLFVSHNLQVVKQLCNKTIFMKNGMLKSMGKTSDIIEDYLNDGNIVNADGTIPMEMDREIGTGEAYFTNARIYNSNDEPVNQLAFNQTFKIKLLLQVVKPLKDVVINVNIASSLGESLIYASEKQGGKYLSRSFDEGVYEIDIDYNVKLLPNNYKLILGLNRSFNGQSIDWIEGVCPFKVNKISYDAGADFLWDAPHGYAEANSNWSYKKIN